MRTNTLALSPVLAALGLLLCPAGQHAPALAQSAAYQSPYNVEFTMPRGELVGDLERTERGDPRMEAVIPHSEWYAPRTREIWHSWGPKPRAYPLPAGFHEWSLERKRERVVAVAMRFLGYGYQHHHIPDWNPPANWPWAKTCFGSNGKGVDCSNFTGFVYNLGFGLRFSTDVHDQSEQRYAKTERGEHPIERIDLPESYEERIKVLRTGDLLYIRNNAGRISHVVIWVGPIGQSRDGTPLILDSHGEDVRDDNGQKIPCGIQLRPFRKNSWYNHSASHAHRIFAGR